MARRRDYQKWGKIFAIIAGILFILGGILLIMHILSVVTLGTFEMDLVAKGFLLRLIGIDWIIAILGITLGALTLVLLRADVSDTLRGILLIILGIIGIGIPGLLDFIAGILYIIAGAKRR